MSAPAWTPPPDDLVDVEALLASPDLRHLTPGTIRVWATRGKIQRYGYVTIKGRRCTRYSLKEVRDLVRTTSTPSEQIV